VVAGVTVVLFLVFFLKNQCTVTPFGSGARDVGVLLYTLWQFSLQTVDRNCFRVIQHKQKRGKRGDRYFWSFREVEVVSVGVSKASWYFFCSRKKNCFYFFANTHVLVPKFVDRVERMRLRIQREVVDHAGARIESVFEVGVFGTLVFFSEQSPD